MEEEIDCLTFALKDTTQPSSQARTQAPDYLDHIFVRVEQMYVLVNLVFYLIQNT